MTVIYHPHAETELIEAAKYYESRVAGLGKRFLEESDTARVVDSRKSAALANR
jgi:hypothetical protein